MHRNCSNCFCMSKQHILRPTTALAAAQGCAGSCQPCIRSHVQQQHARRCDTALSCPTKFKVPWQRFLGMLIITLNMLDNAVSICKNCDPLCLLADLQTCCSHLFSSKLGKLMIAGSDDAVSRGASFQVKSSCQDVYIAMCTAPKLYCKQRGGKCLLVYIAASHDSTSGGQLPCIVSEPVWAMSVMDHCGLAQTASHPENSDKSPVSTADSLLFSAAPIV